MQLVVFAGTSTALREKISMSTLPGVKFLAVVQKLFIKPIKIVKMACSIVTKLLEGISRNVERLPH